MMEIELPNGWIELELKNLVELQGGFAFKSDEYCSQDEGIPIIRMGNLSKQFKIRWTGTNQPYFPKERLSEVKKYLLREGDLLICLTDLSSSGDYLGTVAFMDRNVPALLNQRVSRFHFDEDLIDKQFLYYQLRSPDFRRYMVSDPTGTLQKNTSHTYVLDYNFELPPLPEQKRIVAKLDIAFKHLETIKTKLERIPELLKNFRQTVLTQAITGKLTEKWRKTNVLHSLEEEIKQHILSDKVLAKEFTSGLRFESGKNPWKEFPNVPETWTWATAAEVVEKGADIVYGIVQPGAKLEQGVPYVRGTDIQDGKIMVDQLLKTSSEIAKRYERASLKGGDVLLGIIRSTKVAKVPSELEGANITQGTARFRPSKFILTGFMEIWLSSEMIQKWLHDHYRGIDMPGLNLKDVRKVPFAIPPIIEQQEIINRVCNLFARADAIESQYISLKENIDKLPQTLLAKAFRGELVEQDENDEPASELLQRIQEAKQSLNGAKQKMKAKPKNVSAMELDF
jgi:type I restriction enzyme, S subunit